MTTQQLPPLVYAYVQAWVTPEDNEAAMKVVIKEQDEQLKAALLSDLDMGFSIFGKQPPQARYLSFMASTLPADLPHALNPDFIKERDAARKLTGDDKLMALMAESFVEERNQWQEGAMVAASQGVDPAMLPKMPPHLENIPMLWPLLAQLPDYCWHKVSVDFRRLYNNAARRGMNV